MQYTWFCDSYPTLIRSWGVHKIRVGQGFWVYGIQGLFKSGIRYISAEIWVFGISRFLNFRYKVYLPFLSLWLHIPKRMNLDRFMLFKNKVQLKVSIRVKKTTRGDNGDVYMRLLNSWLCRPLNSCFVDKVILDLAWHQRHPVKAHGMRTDRDNDRSSDFSAGFLFFVPARWTKTNRKVVNLYENKWIKLFRF